LKDLCVERSEESEGGVVSSRRGPGKGGEEEGGDVREDVE